jgi:hypothetical protein
MALTKAKQLDKPVGTRKRVNAALTIVTGTSAYVTTPAFAGSAAGGSNTAVGVFTTAPTNYVALFRRLNGKEVRTADDRRIFGRTTHAAGVFTTRLYVTDNAGAETEYAPIAGDNLNGVAIDILFGEVVQFATLNATDTVNGLDSVDETGGADPNSHLKQIDVFGGVTNGQTAFVLTQTPKVGSVAFLVNGQAQTPTLDYTLAGLNLTWTARHFAIEATDEIVAIYDR